MEQDRIQTNLTADIASLMGPNYTDYKAMIKLGELYTAWKNIPETTDPIVTILSQNIKASLATGNTWRAIAAVASLAAEPSLINNISPDLIIRTLTEPTKPGSTPDMADLISNGLDSALRGRPQFEPALDSFLSHHPTVASARTHGQTRPKPGFDPRA